MKVTRGSIPGVLLFEPRTFPDARGFFLETHHQRRYAEAGLDVTFVQDGWSRSMKDTLRGLHFQQPQPQGKLVYVTQGAVFDVVVDVRRGSPTFGEHYGTELTEDNRHQLWVPPGFAHGFCVLSDRVDLHYKFTAHYDGSASRVIAWNDPDLGIRWPIDQPVLSPADAAAPRLCDALMLPAYDGV